MWILCARCIEMNCHIKRIRTSSQNEIYGEINRLLQCSAQCLDSFFSSLLFLSLLVTPSQALSTRSKNCSVFYIFVIKQMAWILSCVVTGVQKKKKKKENWLLTIDCDYAPLLFAIILAGFLTRMHSSSNSNASVKRKKRDRKSYENFRWDKQYREPELQSPASVCTSLVHSVSYTQRDHSKNMLFFALCIIASD